MSRRTDRHHPESGSALIFIFLGVALFAALSFAVMNMGRSSGGTGLKSELTDLQAGDIIQFGQNVRTAVQKLSIENVPDSQIAFDTAALEDYSNTGCTSDSCRVFSSAGGGATYTLPDPKLLDEKRMNEDQYGSWYFTGANEVTGAGTDADGADSKDLLAILPWLKKDICLAINKGLAVPEDDGEPPQIADDYDRESPFNGAYANGDIIGGTALNGRRAACFRGENDGNGKGTYHYFQVLRAR